jgi:DNA primase
MLNQNQIEELKQKNPLEVIVGQYVQLRSVSGELKGPCSLQCGGGDDRFVIFPPGDRYWCRRCESNGDVLDFVMAKFGCSFPEAIAHLGGGDAPITSPPPNLQILKPDLEPELDPFDEIDQAERQALIENWMEELDKGEGETAEVFNPPESLAPLTPLQYIYAMRMLEPDIVEKYRLGYNNEPFELAGRRIPPGITIPLMQGREIVGFKVRTYSDDFPKYFRIGKGSYTQNRESLTKFDTVLIAEGEFDGMLLDQIFGHKYACISFGGTSDIKKANLPLLLFDATRVWWAFDGDDAGYSAAKKIDGTNDRYRKISMPPGEDVTSYFLQTGTKAFSGFIESQMQEDAQ